jgi:hypothetical protein
VQAERAEQDKQAEQPQPEQLPEEGGSGQSPDA